MTPSELAESALRGILPGFAAAFLVARLASPRWLPAALAGGMLAAYGLLKSWPPWPWALAAGNNDGTQWLVWSVCASALASLGGEGRASSRASGAVGCIVLAAQAWLMLTNLRARWSPERTAIEGAAAVLALLVTFAVLARAIGSRRGTSIAFPLCLCFVADGAILAHGGSLLLAQLASAIAAALAGIAVQPRSRRRLPAAAALVLASAHGGLLVAGHHFAEPEPWALLAAAATPLAAWGWTLRRRGEAGARAGATDATLE